MLVSFQAILVNNVNPLASEGFQNFGTHWADIKNPQVGFGLPELVEAAEEEEKNG